MVFPKCCIPGCCYEGSERYRFPNPKKETVMLQKWIVIIGGDLTTMNLEDVYNCKRICKKHFEKQFLNPGRKGLLRTALPTLFIQTCSRVHNVEHVETDPSDISNKNAPTLIPIMQSCEMEVSELVKQNSSKSYERRNTVTPPLQLLKGVGVSRATKLTPKKKFLYGEALQLKRKVMIMKKRCKTFKARLAAVEKITEEAAFVKLSKNMSTAANLFTRIQYRESLKKPKGRRFTSSEKILALSIYKQSPKAYRLLQKLFTLPCHRTLTKLLHGLPLQTGINQKMFRSLQRSVQLLPVKHRFCSLLFDEMKLMANLQYDHQNDRIVGFEDFGEEVRPNIADHVLVLMVRGCIQKFKQPVAFYFCKGATKSVDLQRILKDVITALQKIGLQIVCTVCDQNSTNVAAITQLKRDCEIKYIRGNREDEWRNDCFEINNKKIIPIYDPPHLLKGIRNNLLKKNITCIIKGKSLTANWEHVTDLYYADEGAANIRVLPKLTENHVIEDKIPKMKVKMAAQVLSQRVSAIMRLFASDKCKLLPKEAEQTADILLFFDELFDSVNASFHKLENGKVYRTAVHKSSLHHRLWADALQVLSQMKTKHHGREVITPSIKNWRITIEGFQHLWKYLSSQGIKSLLTRNINQDPLENFFGAVRSHGIRNNNPTCFSFVATYKTLLLNNLISSKSVGTNCEDIDSGSCLENLTSLFTNSTVHRNEDVCTYNSFEELQLTDVEENCNMDKESGAYVCGFIIRKLQLECSQCKSALLSPDIDASYHVIIEAREYQNNSRKLVYPKPEVCDIFNLCKQACATFLPNIAHTKNIKLQIFEFLSKQEKLISFHSCKEHNILEIFVKKSIIMLIHNWCKCINRILTGKEQKIVDTDIIQRKARMFFLQHKRK